MSHYNRKGELPEPRVMIILVIILLFAAPVAWVLATNGTPSSPITTTTGAQATYVIYKSGANTNALNTGTGVIDYSNADPGLVISDALYALNGAGGGTVNIKTGTYILLTSVYFCHNVETSPGVITHYPYSNVALVGDSGAILKVGYTPVANEHMPNYGPFDGNALVVLYKGENNQIKDIELDGNNIAGTNGIASTSSASERSNYFLIENCIIHDFAYSNDAALDYADGRGIYLDGVENTTIRNVYSYDNFLGIEVGDYQSTRIDSSHDRIIDSNCIDNDVMGIYAYHTPGMIISGNYVSGSHGDYSPTIEGAGIWVGESNLASNHYVINGNTITSCVTGVRADGSDNILSNNQIIYNDRWGVTGTSWSQISNNMILNNGQDTSLSGANRSGIYWGWGARNMECLITGNTIGNTEPVTVITQLYGVWDERDSGSFGSYGSRIYTNNIFVNDTGFIPVMMPYNHLGNSNSVFYNNIGFRTEEWGSTVMPAGVTYKQVTHQLDVMPDVVMVTGTTMSTASLYIDDISLHTFNLRSNITMPGDTTIYWYVEGQPHAPFP
jgi:hypothetical protein